MTPLSSAGLPYCGDFLARTAVIIPALNEAPCIGQTVFYWRARCVGLVRVVDNDSSDETAILAAKAGAEVFCESLRGYGAAAWMGTRRLPPAIEWILFSSADGSDRLDPDEAAAFQAAIDWGAVLVLGERVSRKVSRRRLTPLQRFGNSLSCALIALGWAHRFRDMASLRLIRRDVFEQLELRDRAFGWNVEMQVRALERGLRIAEIPVTSFPRMAGESKISGNLVGVLRAGLGILGMVAKLRFGRVVPIPGAEMQRAANTHISSSMCCHDVADTEGRVTSVQSRTDGRGSQVG